MLIPGGKGGDCCGGCSRVSGGRYEEIVGNKAPCLEGYFRPSRWSAVEPRSQTQLALPFWEELGVQERGSGNRTGKTGTMIESGQNL